MGEECVGVSLRIAIKKPVCIDSDATDTCCWQTECLVWVLFLQQQDGSELSLSCCSPGPHL